MIWESSLERNKVFRKEPFQCDMRCVKIKPASYIIITAVFISSGPALDRNHLMAYDFFSQDTPTLHDTPTLVKNKPSETTQSWKYLRKFPNTKANFNSKPNFKPNPQCLS